MDKEDIKEIVKTIVMVGAIILVALLVMVLINIAFGDKPFVREAKASEVRKIQVYRIVEEKVGTFSAFNTVAWQTDGSPCIAASGAHICGRGDVLACPGRFPLGSLFLVSGSLLKCEDRTSSRFNGRFDISFDKDVQGAREFGLQRIKYQYLVDEGELIVK